MEFKFTEKEDYCTIELVGDLIAQYYTSDLLEKVRKQIEDGNSNFLIDLQNLKFINSSGLSLLLNILNLARKGGGETVLINITEHLTKLLVITKLHSIFTVATNIDEAIVHFKKPVDIELSE